MWQSRCATHAIRTSEAKWLNRVCCACVYDACSFAKLTIDSPGMRPGGTTSHGDSAWQAIKHLGEPSFLLGRQAHSHWLQGTHPHAGPQPPARTMQPAGVSTGHVGIATGLACTAPYTPMRSHTGDVLRGQSEGGDGMDVDMDTSSVDKGPGTVMGTGQVASDCMAMEDQDTQTGQGMSRTCHTHACKALNMSMRS